MLRMLLGLNLLLYLLVLLGLVRLLLLLFVDFVVGFVLWFLNLATTHQINIIFRQLFIKAISA